MEIPGVASHDRELIGQSGKIGRLAERCTALRPEDTGASSEQPAHDLSRALAIWSIALEELAFAGLPVFEAGIADPSVLNLSRSTIPEAWQRTDDYIAIERAQHRMLSAAMAGDIVLDSFAWAELIRRDVWRPGPGDGSFVVVLWTLLMTELDRPECDSDPMRQAARYLDVTLDAARDMLVAHRDPELVLIRGASNWGSFSLDLDTFSIDRLAASLDTMRQIMSPVPRQDLDRSSEMSLRIAIDREMALLLGRARHLSPSDRKKMRRAYRIAGMHSPSFAAIAERVASLVELYLAAREA